MDVEFLKRVITSQREEMLELFRRERIVEREVDSSKLKPLLESHGVLAVIGVRRSGKTVYTWLLHRGRRFGYINFFDERLSRFGPGDFAPLLRAFYELYGPDLRHIVLDEPQEAEGWERFVSRLAVSKAVTVTGSSSRLLGGELATALTGRHVDLIMYPFSFREYLSARGVTLEEGWEYSDRAVASVKAELRRYLEVGGFPEALRLGRAVLASIYGDIVTKDIVLRHGVRNVDAVREAARYLMSNTGGEFTYSRLRRVAGLRDVHTARNYVRWMEEAFLVLVHRRFSRSVVQQGAAPRKIYAVDTGLARTASFSLSEDIGRLMETAVAVELHRRASYGFARREFYYWRDGKGEVDFIVVEAHRPVEAIQVSFVDSLEELPEREVRGLARVSRTFGVGRLTVITWDAEGAMRVDGAEVRAVPLWRWLLV